MLPNNHNLNNQLQNDLKELLDYSKLVDRFFTSKNVPDAVTATKELVKQKLHLKEVSLNYVNSEINWVSELMLKVFEIKKISGLKKVNNAFRFSQLKNFEFSFVPANSIHSGFYLQEDNLGFRVFYFDVNTQRLFFDANCLAHIVNSPIGKELNEDNFAKFIHSMNAFADALVEAEFALDLNIVDYENDQVFYVDKVDIPVNVTDELFLSATKNGYYVGALPDGLAIELDDKITLNVQAQLDAAGHSQWQYRVLDNENEWSFVQVLQKFDFLSDWYIKYITSVEVMYRDEIFLS